MTSTAEPSRGPAASPFARREQPIEHVAHETRSNVSTTQNATVRQLGTRHSDLPRFDARFGQRRQIADGVNIAYRQVYVGTTTSGRDPSSSD